MDRLGRTLTTVAVPPVHGFRRPSAAKAKRTTPGPSASGPTGARASLFAAPRVRVALLLLAPLLLLTFSSPFFAPTDPDYWWHVQTGQYIVETGTLPRLDSYPSRVTGPASVIREWLPEVLFSFVTHEWLTEAVLYVVQQRYGYVGNVALAGLVGALTALAVYVTCRLRGLGEPAAAILMFGAASMTMVSANVRPQIVTTLLLAVCALLLTLYKQGRPRALWPIPLLMVLWVNLHGGYAIGLALLGLTIVGEGVARALGRPAAPLRPLLVVTVLAAAATLLSPYGIAGILFPLNYAGTVNVAMQHVAEWRSPDFHQPYWLTFAASLLLAIVLGVGRRPLGLTEALWIMALALMGLQSVRHIALYAVVVTPLLAARLQAELPALRHALATWRRPGLLAVTWLVLGLVVAATIGTAERRDRLQLGREPSAAIYPVGAVEYLRAHDLPGNLFNTYHWGGYLLYQLHPRYPVFIDGRPDLYGDGILEAYLQAVTLRPGWRAVLDEHDVRIVLVEKDSPLAVVLGDDPAWRTGYAGEVERLLVRD